eukprot:CAMPEP_0197534630 /NCGR_PEP_ID=MMETSP1318-20131121/47789_1 /TAXON_ID=552666 /ORGANISM="Partenskyella glossopodia, Strain RCC365" /LENGTH=49 /DNA_ID= /DNA_START= /DNA_END= /DNA_ORIENTATION=
MSGMSMSCDAPDEFHKRGNAARKRRKKVQKARLKQFDQQVEKRKDWVMD